MSIIVKQGIVFLMVTSTLGSTLLMPLIHLDFEIRRDYIYETLCINKEKPISVCGGACYLNDRLADAMDHQQKEADNKIRAIGIAFFKEELSSLYNSPGAAERHIQASSFYPAGEVIRFSTSLFRPPRFYS